MVQKRRSEFCMLGLHLIGTLCRNCNEEQKKPCTHILIFTNIIYSLLSSVSTYFVQANMIRILKNPCCFQLLFLTHMCTQCTEARKSLTMVKVSRKTFGVSTIQKHIYSYITKEKVLTAEEHIGSQVTRFYLYMLTFLSIQGFVQ